ncbi:hypothetical protein TWF718_002449 [Orbilia javanica]|uniref:Uncharacterized protein n=1 Tax=Orbilia javanica TaxID=47235 RepID=A0AAN8MNF7_9PEZI
MGGLRQRPHKHNAESIQDELDSIVANQVDTDGNQTGQVEVMFNNVDEETLCLNSATKTSYLVARSVILDFWSKMEDP